MATIGQRMGLPTRRTVMSRAERDEAVALLVRYFLWDDSGRTHDRWLASGVGRASQWDAPRVRTSKPGSREPAPAAPPDDDGDVALLLTIHEFIASHRRTSQRILRLKALGEYSADHGDYRPLSNEQIGKRLGWGPKKVAGRWRELVLEFINAVVPGVSGGWATARPIPK